MGSHQRCQVRFRTSRQNLGILLRCCRGQWPHLAITGYHLVFLELPRDSRFMTGNLGFLLCCPGKSNLPFELGGRAGDYARVTAGHRDLSWACVQDLMFLFRGDRDLGVAFPTHQGFQVSSRGEAKDSALLSSQGGISWSPLSGLKGVKPPVEFGERTRDCSPGYAGKEGPHLAMTGASHAFSRAAVPVWDFS